MSIRRVVPDVEATDIDRSRTFYVDFLGFQVAMDMGWIVTVVSPSNPTAQINLMVVESPTTQRGLAISVEVLDVPSMHARAEATGLPIVYPLTDEPWGVRRFWVADPNGVVVNVMMHLKT